MQIDTYLKYVAPSDTKLEGSFKSFRGLDSVVSLVKVSGQSMIYKDYTPLIAASLKLIRGISSRRRLSISEHNAAALLTYGILTKYQKDWGFLRELSNTHQLPLPDYKVDGFSLPVSTRFASPSVPRKTKSEGGKILLWAECYDVIRGSDITKQGKYLYALGNIKTNVRFNLSALNDVIHELETKISRTCRLKTRANIGAVNIKPIINLYDPSNPFLVLRITDPFANVFETYKNSFAMGLAMNIINKYKE